VKEREEAKRIILEESPHIFKDALEFMLSLPIERNLLTPNMLVFIS
jgi:hypothetical protein